MCAPADIRYDVASGMVRGKRAVQEDALATDFRVGSGFGFAVLSDGMGGHAAGDVASNIVVTEVFSELKLQSIDIDKTVANISGILSNAAKSANQCLSEHASGHPDTRGMGATLVAPVLSKDKLFWISIGDSPLFLFRNGQLRQLNEDHSMAPQIDCMVKSGMLSESEGRDHPDRNCLTSALLGTEIPQIDCPDEPCPLLPGDLVIAASDGLQFLSDAQIRDILTSGRGTDSDAIVAQLLAAIAKLDHPYQDNVCITVIRVLGEVAATARPPVAKPKANRAVQRPIAAATPPPPAKPASGPRAPGPLALLNRILGSGLLR